MKSLRVAAVQFESAPSDKQANFVKIERFVRSAADRGVEMIVFPECCITGYWHLRKLSREQLAALAEPAFDGPSPRRLARLAREFRMSVGAGFIELADDGRMYKAYVVAMPDGQLARHRKMHAFVNPHLTCGDSATVFDTPHGWRVGVLICYDCNIIENVRMVALRGAKLLLAPHQTGGCASRSPHAMGLVDRSLWDNRQRDPRAIEAELAGPKGRGWIMRWLPSRAHDNGMFLAFSNGVGVDDDEIRTGNSMILDCYGRVLAETNRPGDDMVIADLDPALLDNCTGQRWLRTRRPELYGQLTVPTGNEIDTRTSRMGRGGVL